MRLQDQKDQRTVEDLRRQLNQALARVDQLSADLAKVHPLHDVQPMPRASHCPD